MKRIAGRHQREAHDGHDEAGEEQRPRDVWLEVDILRHQQDHVVAPQPRPRHRAAREESPGEDAPVAPQQPKRDQSHDREQDGALDEIARREDQEDASLDPEQEGEGCAPSSSRPSPGEPKGDCHEDQDAQQHGRDQGAERQDASDNELVSHLAHDSDQQRSNEPSGRTIGR